jgi:hypothetical protein
MNTQIYKTPAPNERFHASGGVCPQTVLWEFGSVSPSGNFVLPPPDVKPPPRCMQAADCAMDNELEI